MKKLGIVLGVAAVATMTGCRDVNFGGGQGGPQQATQVPVATTEPTPPPAVEPQPLPPAPADTTVTVELVRCKCAPGTTHEKPCACGAPDCRCVVVAKPAPAVEPEYTVYVVQRGDYLAKISKRYNITLAALRRANPSLKNDVIRIGQKIRLPGKVDVGEQKTPTFAAPVAKAKKAPVPFVGATKEYVVKSGDTLGGIAYRNGITVRQLKELNGLSGDMVRVGQKLQVPADGKPAAKAVEKKAEKPAKAKDAAVAAPEPQPAPAAPEEPAVKPAVADEPVVEPEAQPEPQQAQPAAAAPAEPATMQYVVAEGDDMTSVSIEYGVSAAMIRELNNLGDNDQLKPGQVIKLPVGAQQ